ncbi:MAG TPA: hypothetical protein DEO85_07690 [Maritimibacter sp.]|nr:hypothetical protein [Maritimibacter sp.]
MGAVHDKIPHCRSMQKVARIKQQTIAFFRPGLLYKSGGLRQAPAPGGQIGQVIIGQDMHMQISGRQQAHPHTTDASVVVRLVELICQGIRHAFAPFPFSEAALGIQKAIRCIKIIVLQSQLTVDLRHSPVKDE